MVYNKPYNTRHSVGRYNTPGQFVAAVPQAQNYQAQQQQQQPQQQHQQQHQQQQHQPQQQFQSPAPLMPQQQQFNQPRPAQNNGQHFQPVQQSEVDMKQEQELEGAGEEAAPIPHWMKSKLPGVKKISKKEKRRRQNEHLRRLITPKNALMVLNEMMLHDQLANQFKVEPADTTNKYYKNTKTSFCADLTLDGVTYKGFGENKLTARNAAAEQAIRDLIIKRMSKAVTNELNGEGQGDVGSSVGADEEDPLPMIQLASFALHKLFSEWEYSGHKVPQLRPPASLSTSETEMEALAVTSPKPRAAKKPKELPANAGAMHPCMLLTYMRPQLDYRELAVEGDRPQNMLFTLGVDVDGATYIGKASNKKEARKQAARSACQALFGVHFDDVATAVAPLAGNAAPAAPATPATPTADA